MGAEPVFHGVNIQRGTRLRVASLAVDARGTPSLSLQLQWEMHSAWVDLARLECEHAVAARDSNPGSGGDGQEFGEALYEEMVDAMAFISAVAFAFESFSTSVRTHFLGGFPVRARQSAATRIQTVFTTAFRVPNHLSLTMREMLGQVFQLRNLAVHPPVRFVDPVSHPVWPVAVEPSYVNFRVENAVAAVRSLTELLPFLLEHPRPGSDNWLAWCESTLKHLREQPFIETPTRT